MQNRIIKIHLENSYSKSTKSISKVQLSDGSILTVASVVVKMDSGHTFYYLSPTGSRSEVGTAPHYPRPFLQTKGDTTGIDGLLTLSKF